MIYTERQAEIDQAAQYNVTETVSEIVNLPHVIYKILPLNTEEPSNMIYLFAKAQNESPLCLKVRL